VCEQPLDGLAHQRGTAGVRRIRLLIQRRQLAFPQMQAHGDEGIILASPGPRLVPAIHARRAHVGCLLSRLSRPLIYNNYT
jgi:hypothetical protein